jgi:gluconolactonase
MRMDTLADGLAFPEGPAFAPDGSLWFVEYEGGAVTRWDSGRLERHAVGGQPNGLAFDARGRAWVCDAGRNEVRRSDAALRTWELVASTIDGVPLLMPNDLAFDACGNLVFTCPGADSSAAGYVCCLRPDGTLSKIAENLAFPNGLAFADGGRTLVVAETYGRRVWRGAWDDTDCRWIDPQPWAEVGGTTDGPDGMAFGADGLLYVAVYSLGCVKAVAPDGSTASVYELPGNNPTNCAFDPSGRLGLVVTEAEKGLLLSLPQLGTGLPLFDGGDAWPAG